MKKTVIIVMLMLILCGCKREGIIKGKVIGSDDEESLLELQMAVTDYPETTRLIEKRLRELR